MKYWTALLLLFCLATRSSAPVTLGGKASLVGKSTFDPVSAAGGIAFRSKTDTTAGGFTATSITLNKPAGTISGDVLVLIVTTGTAHSITNLEFTLRESSTLVNAGFSCSTLVAGGSEPSSYTIYFTAVETGVATLLCYSGVNATPFDLDAINSAAPGAGSPHTTAPVTPSVSNSMIVGTIFIDPGTSGFTAVDGYNLRTSLLKTSGASMAVADKLQTTATAEGVQITEDLGGTWGQYTLSLKP